MTLQGLLSNDSELASDVVTVQPLALQTLMPAVMTPNSQTVLADVDGDGLNELVMLDGDLKQLSIAHQFRFSDIDLTSLAPNLSGYNWDDSTRRWMTVWGTQGSNMPGGWGVGPDDVVLAADLDGDGAEELFIYNLATSSMGVLKWQTDHMQTLSMVHLPLVSFHPLNGPQWAISPGDQYCVLHGFNGDAAAIFGFSATALTSNSSPSVLGVITYGANSLSTPWCFDKATIGGPGPTWNLSITDQFYGATLPASPAPSAPSVIIYNPDQNMATLQWNGSDFDVYTQSGYAGSWGFAPADQLQCADLDGNGTDEILISNANYIGALQWKPAASQFQSIAISHNQVTGPNYSRNIGADDQYFCHGPNAGTPAQILAWLPGSSQMALLACQSGNFTCSWSGSQLGAAQPWPVSSLYRCCSANASSPASPGYAVFSNTGAYTVAPVLSFGAVEVAPSPSSLAIASSSNLPVPAWSPAFLAGAPGNDFIPFTGDQLAIYNFISTQFPIPGVTNPDAPPIRSTYINTGDSNKFEDFASGIRNLPNPQPGVWQASDWNTVVGIISAECDAVDTVYSVYAEIGKLTGDFNVFQQADLGAVKTNIKKLAAGDPESAVDYWVGQIFVTVLWGISSLSGLLTEPEGGGAALGAIFSVLASLAGADLGFSPAQTKSYAFKEVEQELLGALSQSIVTQSMNQDVFLKDPVKLAILNALNPTVWEIPESLPAVSQPPFSNFDRLSMYQMLMPFYFTRYIDGQPIPFEGQPPTLFTMNGKNYALFSRNNVWISLQGFQSSNLYQDLFTTIGVSLEDFFLGNGGWANMPLWQG